MTGVGIIAVFTSKATGKASARYHGWACGRRVAAGYVRHHR